MKLKLLGDEQTLEAIFQTFSDRDDFAKCGQTQKLPTTHLTQRKPSNTIQHDLASWQWPKVAEEDPKEKFW